jgi:hypothetical protein
MLSVCVIKRLQALNKLSEKEMDYGLIGVILAILILSIPLMLVVFSD